MCVCEHGVPRRGPGISATSTREHARECEHRGSTGPEAGVPAVRAEGLLGARGRTGGVSGPGFPSGSHSPQASPPCHVSLPVPAHIHACGCPTPSLASAGTDCVPKSGNYEYLQ